MNLLLLPLPELGCDDEIAAKVCTKALGALLPTLVVTDYSPGWSIVATRCALDLGIPVHGALPFPVEAEEKKRARSNLVFNDTDVAYYSRPGAYFSWLGLNVDAGLIWDSGISSPYSNRVLVELVKRGKRTITLSRGVI